MVFKRRERRTPWRAVSDFIYPPGGWRRAFSYVGYRLRRLPDPPGRIARGIAAGIFVCFTPFFGFHFLLGALLAWLIRGNIVAAMLATLIGNPLTFPVIAAVSITLGEWILQTETPVPLSKVLGTFSSAFGELTENIVSIITGGVAQWAQLQAFFHGVFLPYVLGGLLPGVLSAALGFMLSKPLITAYQARRARLIGRPRAPTPRADTPPHAP